MQVSVCGLYKRYGDLVAVDDLNFSFESGQIFGFVGPNGAGKTTTMRMMANLEEPDKGDVTIDGVSVIQFPEQGHDKMGYVPDALPEMKSITVYEYLDFFSRASGLRGTNRVSTLNRMIDFTGLTELLHREVARLSKGNKQKVTLTRALLHNPSVLVLDEPAAGLDPKARVELRELLRVLADQGKAILVSSHILSELTEMCDGVLMIDHGRLLKTGSLADILDHKDSHLKVSIRTLDDAERLLEFLKTLPHVSDVRLLQGRVWLEHSGDRRTSADLLAMSIRQGFSIVEFKEESRGLEDVFMKMTHGVRP
ncbi:MAG: ABC transporter ATP-binding protein [Acidobacteria bacterium]|nr:ABC transporter ATP-binding protein [Acidobacteriota bacterium]